MKITNILLLIPLFLTIQVETAIGDSEINQEGYTINANVWYEDYFRPNMRRGRSDMVQDRRAAMIKFKIPSNLSSEAEKLGYKDKHIEVYLDKIRKAYGTAYDLTDDIRKARESDGKRLFKEYALMGLLAPPLGIGFMTLFSSSFTFWESLIFPLGYFAAPFLDKDLGYIMLLFHGSWLGLMTFIGLIDYSSNGKHRIPEEQLQKITKQYEKNDKFYQISTKKLRLLLGTKNYVGYDTINKSFSKTFKTKAQAIKFLEEIQLIQRSLCRGSFS